MDKNKRITSVCVCGEGGYVLPASIHSWFLRPWLHQQWSNNMVDKWYSQLCYLVSRIIALGVN